MEERKGNDSFNFFQIREEENRKKTKWDPSIELTHADLNKDRALRLLRVEECFIRYSELVRKNYNRDILMMWVLLFLMCNMFTMFAHSQELLALLIVNSVSIHYSTQIKNSFKSGKTL